MDGPMPDPATLDDGDDDVVGFIPPCLLLRPTNNFIASCRCPGEGKAGAVGFPACVVDL